MSARPLLTEEQRAILAALDHEQRAAVKRAFCEWVGIADAEGYAPITRGEVKCGGAWLAQQPGWNNFGPEVDHSALLQRILGGKAPLPERPALSHAYPVYPD